LKENKEYIKFLGLGLCALIIVYFPFSPILLKISQGVNDLSSQFVYKLSPKSIKNFKLVSIAIDDHSLNAINQRWPWRRPMYAQLIKILDKEKVKTIGIDIAFTGESENRDDDRILKEALESVSARVVLAYFFDYRKGVPVLPLAQFREAAYSLGMLNMPLDSDNKARRLRGYVRLKDDVYYSFPVVISAAHLNQKPQDIVSSLPLLKDRTFFINYLIKPRDITEVSFYDVLENLEKLKQYHGNDFLKDALVLVYPKAEILHDIYMTPLGRISGGILHLNGIANILSKRLIKDIDALIIPFFLFSFLAIFYILLYSGFAYGLLLTLGVLLLDFWLLVFLNSRGIRFEYSRVVLFGFLYFILGSIYKSIYFLASLLRIKNKAALDPLTNLFTFRYFYYHLGLELKKIYFYKDHFLVYIYLENFQNAVESISSENLEHIWQEISSFISLRNTFWTAYSQEGLVGCLISSRRTIQSTVNLLRDNLRDLFLKQDIQSKIKLGYLRLNKGYPIRKILSFVVNDLKKQNTDVVFFRESDLIDLFGHDYSQTKVDELGGMDKDIEEKNRKLLSLIENLNKEHAKTKEAFFEIITSLVNALEARDAYTEGHSQRVCDYALRMAEELGWSQEDKDKLTKAALLHDLGKIGIPDRILHKKGPLDENEYECIKTHEVIGARILEPLKELSDIIPWILHHHERWDGKGYPDGLAGNAIPEAARIIALADVFDAITTGRDYKVALSSEEAIKEIAKNKGTQFDPRLADIFIEMVSRP
jgi:putative nucleotidyltransferase with HDIG domain